MISRSTLIGALVVAELAIAGMAARAVAGDAAPAAGPFGFPGTFAAWHGSGGATPVLDRTFPSGGTPHVVVDVHDLAVLVETGTGSGVRVVDSVHKMGYVSGSVVPVTATATADGVRVVSGGENAGHMHVILFGSLSRQLKLVVPPGAQVEILSGGRVEASGLNAKFIAHVEDGAIHVSNHRGDVDLSTGSGRIYLTDVQAADIAATSGEGRLYFDRVAADRIDAHTNFGRIYATDIRAVDGALTTKEGRVTVSLAGNSDTTVSARVVSDNKIVVSGITAVDDGDDKRTVRLGSGRGHFEIGSDDGSITLTQGANV